MRRYSRKRGMALQSRSVLSSNSHSTIAEGRLTEGELLLCPDEEQSIPVKTYGTAFHTTTMREFFFSKTRISFRNNVIRMMINDVTHLTHHSLSGVSTTTSSKSYRTSFSPSSRISTGCEYAPLLIYSVTSSQHPYFSL